MKENIGISAIIVALLAFVAHNGTVVPNAGLSKPAHAEPQSPDSTPETEGPWLATRAFFHSSGPLPQPQLRGKALDFETPSSLQNCQNDAAICRVQLVGWFGVPAGKKLQFLIATVPDPLHSRLSLLTDSGIAAIQEGASASGWVFSNQWLPWIDDADPDEKDPEKRRAQREAVRRQERQPGILVFHHAHGASDVLVVFLVGETPTAGINPAQFQMARAYMQAVQPETREVRILGPTFSGSFYSLGGLLEADKVHLPAGSAYKIRSGTVTGASVERRFAAGFKAVPSGSYTLDFHSAAASTDDLQCYVGKTLRDLGIDLSHAASLVEDQSEFGDTAAETAARGVTCTGELRVYRFPRDISHLRNSYREAVAASKSNDQASSDIEFSIKDPEKGEDSIPIFSGSQTPVSQYGIVNRIAQAIRREDIRLLHISATNVLDMLFLADFLKRQCPDTRLLLNYPDVLLVEAAQTQPLAGTLVLTSYPGFAAANRWMDHQQPIRPLVFADGNSEGIYNAAVLLLNDSRQLQERLVDYHWRDMGHPPMWLLALDHQGFVPVDVFTHDLDKKNAEEWFQTTPPWSLDLSLPELPRIWELAALVVSLISLGLVGWIWWISAHPLCEQDARFSYGPVAPGEGNWRRFHVFLLVILQAMIIATVCIPAFRSETAPWFLILSIVSCGALLLAAVWLVSHMVLRAGTVSALAVTLAAFAGFVALWVTCCLQPGDRSLFFAFRARELRFGSSPVLPILAALTALVIFAIVHLTRFYLAACQDPGELTTSIGRSLKSRMEDSWHDFAGTLKSSLCLRLTDASAIRKGPLFMTGAVLGFALLFIASFRVWAAMRSIDGAAYDLLSISLQVLVAGLLLVTCANIRCLWHSLRNFLAALATLPLANAFGTVDRTGADRPLWVRRLNLQSIDVHIRTLYELHNMTVLTSDAKGLKPWQRDRFSWIQTESEDYASKVNDLLSVDRSRSRDTALIQTEAVRMKNHAIAREMMLFLHDFWRTRSLAAPGMSVEPSQNGAAATDSKQEPALLDRFGSLAESSVALYYSSFILYGVRQIQNLLIFLSTGFVLLMISLNSYTVHAPRFVGRMLLLLFVVIGVAVVSCLAGLERDPILSRIAGTSPGKLNREFYMKIAAYGALPVLSLLASQFPPISNFLLSWVQPTLEAFK